MLQPGQNPGKQGGRAVRNSRALVRQRRHESRRPGRPRLGGERKLAKTAGLPPGWAGEGTRPYVGGGDRLLNSVAA
jgi:hypothetical protein